jgi:SAM-dependent methyltransferase
MRAENAPVATIELSSEANFCPEGYLLKNPDVKAAGLDAQLHFEDFGKREGRQQVSRALIGHSQYRKRKFNRFARVLSNALRARQFPVTFGASFDLNDYASESANCGFGPFVEEIANNPDKLYLDLGCGLRSEVYENCLYLEVYPSICADIITGTDCTYPIKDNTLDGVGCFAVLEHTREPWKVVDEIHRILKPGGKAFIDWPFLQPVHGYPSHYFNATREGLRSIFTDRGFEIELIDTLPSQAPNYTISWVLGKFINDLPEHKRRDLLGMTVAELISHPADSPFWRAIIAGLPDPLISEFSCGNSLIGRKR